MKKLGLITLFLSALFCFGRLAHSQDVMGFDRDSFGSVVLSRPQNFTKDVQLELSIGNYENEPIINYSVGSIFAQIGKSVGRLDVLTDKGLFPCTAFIVSNKHILTNYHCSLGLLDNTKIRANRIDAIQFVAGYTQTGIEEGTKKFIVIPTPIESSKQLDYAVLEVIGDPSQEFGQLKLSSIMPNNGDPFWIIGHPMGEGQRISREKCMANNPALSGGKLLHTCDTLPGNSGSPVIDAGLQQVVALHHAGSQRNSVNFAILMSDILKNSKILTAYKTPSLTNSLNVEPNKVEQIEVCDELYAAATQAAACYAYEAYIRSCSAHALAPMGRGYMKEFCSVTESVKDPSNDSFSSELPKCPEDIDYYHNCYGMRESTKAGKYIGEFQDNKYDGKGVLNDVSGSKYMGGWKGGEKFGYGEELKIYLSERAGIGITVVMEKNGLKVESVIESGPAIAAGIEPGDLITDINNSSLIGLTLDKSVSMIAGEIGSDITLTVLKNLQGQSVQIKMQRAIFVQNEIHYSGQWANNKKNGEGVQKILSNDIIYEGEFKDGEYHGFGHFKFAANSRWAGDFFVGEFKKGNFDGLGVYTFRDGTKYDGNWRDGYKEGKGTMAYASGSKYVGAWQNDMKNGEGTMTYASGDKYVGTWKDNLRNGEGSYSFKSGASYTGEYQDGLSHGTGKYIYADGASYVGDWKSGFRHGLGAHTKADGTKYTGSWVKGKMHGKGEHKRPDGSVYKGNFRNGVRSGFGKLVFPGGEYEGDFHNDAANGLGTYKFKDGRIYKGSMKDGYQNGYGELEMALGEKYSGNFEMGQISGLGKYQTSSGHVHFGRFKNSAFYGAGISIWKTGQTRFDLNYHEGPPEGLPSNSTVHTVFPFLKKRFAEMSKFQREKVQLILKDQGLYSSAIDGKWGRGTFTGLVQFSLENFETVDLRSDRMSKKLFDAVLR